MDFRLSHIRQPLISEEIDFSILDVNRFISG